MNDRIIALVACLALFVWLWSTEHENRAERLAKRAAAASQLAGDEVDPPATTALSIADIEGAQLCRAAETLTVSSIPLPDGISPGPYLVLDCRGVLRRIEVTPEQISAADCRQATRERDFYVKVLDGRHWIFENIRAIERAAANSAPTDEWIVAGDVESYPTGACFEAMQASTPSQPAAALRAMRWGPWLDSLHSQAARIWTDRRDGLLARVEQRRQRAKNIPSRARRIVNFMALQIEAAGIRGVDRLLSNAPQDAIALPQPGGRSL